MHRLDFAWVHRYSDDGKGVSIPVLLRSGAHQVPVIASVDTGSSFCIFGAEAADALGLDLKTGFRRRFQTANSVFDAHGHEVELSSFGVATHSTVYFFADPLTGKNIPGRAGWLDRVRIALVHHDNKIYLAPYDAA